MATDKGNPAPPAAPKPADAEPTDEPLTLTKAELQKLIDENRAESAKEEREKLKAKAKAKAKAQPQDDDGEEDDTEDSAEIISKAETRAATAEQERDAAKKEALLARVENKLRDWLALNAREFLGSAPDIMLHIERAITADAKDGEVARLIESHAKAFMERNKGLRKVGAPVAAGRNRIAGIPGAENAEDRQVAAAAARTGPPADGQRWSTLNYHG